LIDVSLKTLKTGINVVEVLFKTQPNTRISSFSQLLKCEISKTLGQPIDGKQKIK
jgi:hypothetical protein